MHWRLDNQTGGIMPLDEKRVDSTAVLHKVERYFRTQQFEETQVFAGCHRDDQPIILLPRLNNESNKLIALVNQHYGLLRQCIDHWGGILLRGFECNGADDLIKLIDCTHLEYSIDYSSATPRKNIARGIATSTEISKQFPIYPHNEMAFDKNRPAIVLFYCETAPAKYGQTPIFNCHNAYKLLSDEAKNFIVGNQFKFTRQQIKNNHRFLPVLKESWSNAFRTNDKKIVERKCAERGWGCEWQRNETLVISQLLPICLAHPVTGIPVINLYDCNYYGLKYSADIAASQSSAINKLFIYIMLYSLQALKLKTLSVLQSDGSEIPLEIQKEITHALWNSSIIFDWQKNDILMIDNFKFAHGRLNYIAPRRILTSLLGQHPVIPFGTSNVTTRALD